MKLLLNILFALILSQASIFSQVIEVPIDVQVPIFSKAIALDRNLTKKVDSKSKLNVAVLYQSKFRSSLVSKDNFVENLNKQKFQFVSSVKVHELEYSDQTQLSEWIKKQEIDIVVVTPMRAVDIGKISQQTQSSRVLSFSLVADYANYGISFSIESKSDKPQIVINLKSAKAEGSDFNSHLLKLVRLIEN